MSVSRIAPAGGTNDRLRVLVVSTQFPFPPRFGFAMRVYQLARQLAGRHDITLLTYGGPDDRDGAEELRREFPVELIERDPQSIADKRLMQLLTMPSRRPFCSRIFHSAQMQAAIGRLCADQRFDVIQLESSMLGTYRLPAHSAVVLDEHNVEYEVFKRMHEGERSFSRRTFNRREFSRFRRFERASWREVDACVVTSEREVPLVREHAPDTPVAVVPNGVDLDYFRPSEADVEPETAVFNGLLGYRPNLDAAYHLVDEIWPLVRQCRPDARLTVVGRGAPADLRRLRREGVDVTGEVPDIRPYVHAAAVVLVPVRIGGGTRLKVVEALAGGKAIVSTTLGCEGVNVRDGEHLLVADGAKSFAAAIVRLFDDTSLGRALGRAGRALAETEYSWELAGARLDALYRHVVHRDPLPELSNGGGRDACAGEGVGTRRLSRGASG